MRDDVAELETDVRRRFRAVLRGEDLRFGCVTAPRHVGVGGRAPHDVIHVIGVEPIALGQRTEDGGPQYLRVQPGECTFADLSDSSGGSMAGPDAIRRR